MADPIEIVIEKPKSQAVYDAWRKWQDILAAPGTGAQMSQNIDGLRKAYIETVAAVLTPPQQAAMLYNYEGNNLSVTLKDIDAVARDGSSRKIPVPKAFIEVPPEVSNKLQELQFNNFSALSFFKEIKRELAAEHPKLSSSDAYGWYTEEQTGAEEAKRQKLRKKYGGSLAGKLEIERILPFITQEAVSENAADRQKAERETVQKDVVIRGNQETSTGNEAALSGIRLQQENAFNKTILGIAKRMEDRQTGRAAGIDDLGGGT